MNKLYFKNIKLINIDFKKIIKKNEHKKSIQNIILTNNGYYIFLKKHTNTNLFNVHINLNVLDENDEFVILNEYHKKNKVYQIPLENTVITKEKYEIEIQGNILVFEIYNEQLYDFYVLTKNENLDNYFLNKEISYIKKMLI